MARESKEFRHESLQDPGSVAEYLTALTDGFESRVLRFSDQDGEITLKPRGLVHFDVRASSKRGEATLTIRFNWKTGAEAEEDDGGPLQINGEHE